MFHCRFGATIIPRHPDLTSILDMKAMDVEVECSSHTERLSNREAWHGVP